MARPIAKDHDDKRATILHAAAKLFAREGYGRASMAEVAKACGTSKANIYHYYPSKEALLFDILETHLCYLRDHMASLTFPSDDPAEKLTHLMTEILLAYKDADAEHDVLLSATQALPEDQQAVLRQYQRDFLSYGRNLLRDLAPPHVARDRVKLRALTMSTFGMLNWHYKWNKDADEATRREHAKMIAEITLGGIKNVS